MKCSIVVANYNNGKYLNQLIESIMQQTYSKWELLITDDASTDNSIEIVSQYLDDERIKLIRHKTNLGAAAAFKSAIDNSDGEIIAMLGAEDALVKNALGEIVKQHIKFSKASMIIANLICCDEKLKPTGEIISFDEIGEGETYLNHFGISGWDTFKKDLYKKTEGIDIEQKRAVDQDLYLKLEEVGLLKGLNKNLYYYRSNPNGISQKNNKPFAHEYNYRAIINAYKRRRENGFRNISKTKYNEVVQNYNFLKFCNHLRNNEKLRDSEKLTKQVKNVIENGKPKSINQLQWFYTLLDENKDMFDVKRIKQKLTKSFFIKDTFDFQTIKQLFSLKVKPYRYIPVKTVVGVFIKSFLNWRKK